MVAPVDGVICGDTMASWWVARQQSTYTYQANALELGNYEGLATYSVTPGGGIEAFSVSGATTNCDDDDPCLPDVERGQHDESYRGVFTFAHGRIETAQAHLRVRPGGAAALADTGADSPVPLLGVASIALLLGLALGVQARRRRSPRSGV